MHGLMSEGMGKTLLSTLPVILVGIELIRKSVERKLLKTKIEFRCGLGTMGDDLFL